MEHAELSSSVIFVCHVNFSRRLEAESAAISVLFTLLAILNTAQWLVLAWLGVENDLKAILGYFLVDINFKTSSNEPVMIL